MALYVAQNPSDIGNKRRKELRGKGGGTVHRVKLINVVPWRKPHVTMRIHNYGENDSES